MTLQYGSLSVAAHTDRCQKGLSAVYKLSSCNPVLVKSWCSNDHERRIRSKPSCQVVKSYTSILLITVADVQASCHAMWITVADVQASCHAMWITVADVHASCHAMWITVADVHASCHAMWVTSIVPVVFFWRTAGMTDGWAGPSSLGVQDDIAV